MKETIFGYSLHLDLFNCKKTDEIFRKPGHNDKNGETVLKIFIEYVLNLIDMKPVYEPLVKYYGDHKSNEGFSYIQLINTSNINIHTVSNTKDIYIDLFSCKSFDVDKVRAFAKHYFGPEELDFNFLER